MMFLDVFVFILVLGLLVFFHEMGHFLAAKACGIYVDRFSLGMPPRVAGKRLGETDYCVGLLPIGGYVKMAGQEDVPTSDEERKKEYGDIPPDRWYCNKPVWQRAIVIVSGPLMNLVLALVLYAIVAGVGANVPLSKIDNRIGYVVPDSPAAGASLYLAADSGEDAVLEGEPDAVGWKTGDRILSIDGKEVDSIEDVAIAAALGGGRAMLVRIERSLPDGTKTQYVSKVAAALIGEEASHPRFGVAPYDTALVGAVQEGMPAEKAGIEKDDIITYADGEPVDARTFTRLVSELNDGEALTLTIERGGETMEKTLRPQVIGDFSGLLFAPPLHTEDEEELQAQPVVIGRIAAPDDEEESETDSNETSMEVLPKDIILEVNGEPATVAKLAQLRESAIGGTAALTIERPAILGGLLRRESNFTTEVAIQPVGKVGIIWGEKIVFQRASAAEVLPKAFGLSTEALGRTFQTIASLLTGGVGIKDLGGPVMIYRVTTQAARLGWSWLLEITAFISINLCVFNLLPLPVLDGGHLVFLGYEAVRRKPASRRAVEIIQNVGLALIIALFLFVTFNDIQRWIGDMLP